MTKTATLRFQPYTEEGAGLVAEFNRRISRANPPFLIPADPGDCWLPKIENRKIYQETFLAAEGGEVRGAYTLRAQPFSFAGEVHTVAACQMPISEGIVDKRYSFIGPRILHDALRRQPLLYGLGIGSLNASITRLERAMGWSVQVVPFFFKIRNAFNFFKNIEHLRNTWVNRRMLDAAAYSGVGWAGSRLANLFLTRTNGIQRLLSTEEVSGFSPWADEIWRACESRYAMTAVRDVDVLDVLYPADQPKFIRIKVSEDGRVIGWAVMLDTQMSENKYFGNMRVGSIVDCLALPEDATKVICAAAEALDRRGVDLMLSNQSHIAWRGALKTVGFLQGPSNFILTLSKQVSRLLADIDPSGDGIHINRADGDGPIHL